MRPVYVLDMNKPLMPTCRFSKACRMLKSCEAKVVDTLPFTIQLTSVGGPQRFMFDGDVSLAIISDYLTDSGKENL